MVNVVGGKGHVNNLWLRTRLFRTEPWPIKVELKLWLMKKKSCRWCFGGLVCVSKQITLTKFMFIFFVRYPYLNTWTIHTLLLTQYTLFLHKQVIHLQCWCLTRMDMDKSGYLFTLPQPNQQPKTTQNNFCWGWYYYRSKNTYSLRNMAV